MPSIARGVHVLCPSQQAQGAIANVQFAGPSTASAEMLLPTLPNDDHEPSDDDIAISPTMPICPASSISASTSASKCKHSTLDNDTASSFSKQSHSTAFSNALVLHGIKDIMENISSNMYNGPLAQPHCHRRTSMECQIEATALLQEKKVLTADEVIAFADIFEQNTAKADTYMALIHADV